MKPNSAKTQSYQATRPTSANVGARLYPHQVTVEPLTGMEQCESAWSIARHSAWLTSDFGNQLTAAISTASPVSILTFCSSGVSATIMWNMRILNHTTHTHMPTDKHEQRVL